MKLLKIMFVVLSAVSSCSVFAMFRLALGAGRNLVVRSGNHAPMRMPAVGMCSLRGNAVSRVLHADSYSLDLASELIMQEKATAPDDLKLHKDLQGQIIRLYSRLIDLRDLNDQSVNGETRCMGSVDLPANKNLSPTMGKAYKLICQVDERTKTRAAFFNRVVALAMYDQEKDKPSGQREEVEQKK